MKLQKPQKTSNLLFWIIVIISIITFLAVPGFKISLRIKIKKL